MNDSDNPRDYAREGRIETRIAPDGMKAEIRIIDGPAENPAREEIEKTLQNAGVVWGVVPSAICKIAESLSCEWVEVAAGRPARNGTDARLEVFIDTERKGPLVYEEAAKADLKKLGLVHNIRQGDLIARKIPMEKGEEGMDVFGAPVKAGKTKDLKIKAGANTVFSENGLELTATDNGHLVREGNSFTVQKIFEVKGDVDYGTGDIECLGGVKIHGGVKEKFSVKTMENLEIHGVVEGAKLSSGGAMNLRGSVRGMGFGIVECGGDLTAEYVDQCRIEVKGSLRFKRALLHCDIEAEKTVCLEGEGKGLIAGGTIKAGGEVECATLGAKMGTKTHIHVGVSPGLLQQKKALLLKRGEFEEKSKTVERNLLYLSKLMKEGALNEEQKAHAVRFLKLRDALVEQLEKVDSLVQQADKAIERVKHNVSVKVRGLCYPGVCVSIRGDTFLVREALEGVKFAYEEGKVRIVSL